MPKLGPVNLCHKKRKKPHVYYYKQCACYKEPNNKHNIVSTVFGDDLNNTISLFKASLRHCGDIIPTQMLKQTDVWNS